MNIGDSVCVCVHVPFWLLSSVVMLHFMHQLQQFWLCCHWTQEIKWAESHLDSVVSQSLHLYHHYTSLWVLHMTYSHTKGCDWQLMMRVDRVTMLELLKPVKVRSGWRETLPCLTTMWTEIWPRMDGRSGGELKEYFTLIHVVSALFLLSQATHKQRQHVFGPQSSSLFERSG